METMHSIMLIVHFIGLAMGIGTSFSQMFLGMASSKMEKAEAEKFQVKTLALTKMGVIGLVLLVVSGGYLMTPHWKTLSATPLLMAKLALVVLLIILIVRLVSLGKKATADNSGEALKKMEKIGKGTLPLGIVIVILAVLVFL